MTRTENRNHCDKIEIAKNDGTSPENLPMESSSRPVAVLRANLPGWMDGQCTCPLQRQRRKGSRIRDLSIRIPDQKRRGVGQGKLRILRRGSSLRMAWGSLSVIRAADRTRPSILPLGCVHAAGAGMDQPWSNAHLNLPRPKPEGPSTGCRGPIKHVCDGAASCNRPAISNKTAKMLPFMSLSPLP